MFVFQIKVFVREIKVGKIVVESPYESYLWGGHAARSGAAPRSGRDLTYSRRRELVLRAADMGGNLHLYGRLPYLGFRKIKIESRRILN